MMDVHILKTVWGRGSMPRAGYLLTYPPQWQEPDTTNVCQTVHEESLNSTATILASFILTLMITTLENKFIKEKKIYLTF